MIVKSHPLRLVPSVNWLCLSRAMRIVFWTSSSAASRSRHMKRANARRSGSSTTISSFIIERWLRAGTDDRRMKYTIRCAVHGAQGDFRHSNCAAMARVNAQHGQMAPKKSTQEDGMNWDRVEGNWKQFTGKVKE